MTWNVHPYPLFTTSYDNLRNKTVYEQSGYSPGMTVKQLYLAHILAGIAMNPATMLDPETHVDYAIKLAELAQARMP